MWFVSSKAPPCVSLDDCCLFQPRRCTWPTCCRHTATSSPSTTTSSWLETTAPTTDSRYAEKYANSRLAETRVRVRASDSRYAEALAIDSRYAEKCTIDSRYAEIPAVDFR